MPEYAPEGGVLALAHNLHSEFGYLAECSNGCARNTNGVVYNRDSGGRKTANKLHRRRWVCNKKHAQTPSCSSLSCTEYVTRIWTHLFQEERDAIRARTIDECRDKGQPYDRIVNWPGMNSCTAGPLRPTSGNIAPRSTVQAIISDSGTEPSDGEPSRKRARTEEPQSLITENTTPATPSLEESAIVTFQVMFPKLDEETIKNAVRSNGTNLGHAVDLCRSLKTKRLRR